MLTNAGKDAALALLATGHYFMFLKTITGWRAGTHTEADYTGYNRVAATFGAAANTTPAGGRQRANSGAHNFPQNTSANQDVIAVALVDSPTPGAGTIKAISMLDAGDPVVGTADDAGELITAPAHGLTAGKRVRVIPIPGLALPAGLSEDTEYFVLAAGLTTDAFALSLTAGGTAVNITAKGVALFAPYTPQTIATNATPSIADGQFVVQL